MNFNRHFSALFFVFLAAPAFAQKQEGFTEKIVPLHMPQGDLVHFYGNGYVFSLAKQDLLAMYTNPEMASACSDPVSTTDTLNLDSTIHAFTKISAEYNRYYNSYLRGKLQYFEEGKLQVYCIATGKYLSQIKIVQDFSESGMLMVPWLFRDPANDQTFHSYTQTWLGCPSF